MKNVLHQQEFMNFCDQTCFSKSSSKTLFFTNFQENSRILVRGLDVNSKGFEIHPMAQNYETWHDNMIATIYNYII